MQYLSKSRVLNFTTSRLKAYLSAYPSSLSFFTIRKTHISAQKPRRRQLNAVGKVPFFFILSSFFLRYDIDNIYRRWRVDYCCIGVTYPVWACTGTEYIKVTRERQAVTAHSRNVWAPISLFEHSAAKIQAAATAKIAVPLRCYMHVYRIAFFRLRVFICCVPILLTTHDDVLTADKTERERR